MIKNWLSNHIKNDVFAGITVSLAMDPEVVAFAFVAQIDPLVALSDPRYQLVANPEKFTKGIFEQ